jgi:predicted N-acetyltransferase YhbS
MSEIIRPESSKDYERITKVNDLAFKQPNEGLMISALRRNKKFIPDLSLVAEIDSIVVGHILFFPLNIISGEKSFEVLSLAPMSVVPEYQQKGIGKKLVTKGLKKSKELGFIAVVVLGHPTYYPKFGFEPASKWYIKLSIEDVPDEASMAIELEKGFLKGKAGIIEYPVEYYKAL